MEIRNTRVLVLKKPSLYLEKVAGGALYYTRFVTRF